LRATNLRVTFAIPSFHSTAATQYARIPNRRQTRPLRSLAIYAREHWISVIEAIAGRQPRLTRMQVRRWRYGGRLRPARRGVWRAARCRHRSGCVWRIDLAHTLHPP
jgi:hypothetical protein